MSEPTAAAGASFDELLEHLLDLSQLAESEGFPLFAMKLAETYAYMLNRKNAYAQRVIPPAPRSSDSLRRST